MKDEVYLPSWTRQKQDKDLLSYILESSLQENTWIKCGLGLNQA